MPERRRDKQKAEEDSEVSLAPVRLSILHWHCTHIVFSPSSMLQGSG